MARSVLGAHAWQRLSQSEGTKGERLFDWARLPLVQAGVVDARHWLVVRRPLDKPDELAYYLLWAPPDTPLCTMVQVIGCRWHIEEDLHDAKALGLDHYEVRSYLGWYRHITLVLLAAAFLLGICVQENHSPPPVPDPSADAPPAPTPLRKETLSCSLTSNYASTDAPPAPTPPPLIAWTTSEVRHLLARLIWPLPSNAPLLCQWSQWRRCHQYWASYFHRRRRAKAAIVRRQ